MIIVRSVAAVEGIMLLRVAALVLLCFPIAVLAAPTEAAESATVAIFTALIVDAAYEVCKVALHEQKTKQAWSGLLAKRKRDNDSPPQSAKKPATSRNYNKDATASEWCIHVLTLSFLLLTGDKCTHDDDDDEAGDEKWWFREDLWLRKGNKSKRCEEPYNAWCFVRCGRVYCRYCTLTGKTEWASGIPVKKKWSGARLAEHANTCKAHADSKLTYTQIASHVTTIQEARSRFLADQKMFLSKVMRVVLWLCLENVAMLKLKSLMLCVLTCVDPEINSFSKLNYINAARCREFMMSLSAVVKSKVWADIVASGAISILIDESTDISQSENMIVYIVYMKGGEALVKYVGLIAVPNTDAESIFEAVVEFVTENGVEIGKVAGFCSDGASVMTGWKNAVAARLKKVNPYMLPIHCIAHRLALCCADAASNMDYPETQERTRMRRALTLVALHHIHTNLQMPVRNLPFQRAGWSGAGKQDGCHAKKQSCVSWSAIQHWFLCCRMMRKMKWQDAYWKWPPPITLLGPCVSWLMCWCACQSCLVHSKRMLLTMMQCQLSWTSPGLLLPLKCYKQLMSLTLVKLHLK